VPGLPRPPRCTAVLLNAKDGSGFTYGEAMLVVRREMNLSDLDIAEVRPRKTVTRVLIFEIAGQDVDSKASRLAERMAVALPEFSAKVTVPRRTVELRMTGLGD
jgi:hypothetical protein